jgi:hypothetical protein
MTFITKCLAAVVVAALMGTTAALVLTRALGPKEAVVAPADPGVAGSTADENAQRVVAILRGLTAAEAQLQALRQELNRNKAPQKNGRK